MTNPGVSLRIGTRGSKLALTQAEDVARRWTVSATDRHAELVVIRTQGDLDRTTPLAVIGGQGVFTTALQEALGRGEIDAAVHSAKDLPSFAHPQTRLAAFLNREDARDVLVTHHGGGLADLPPNPRIGTSSRRRIVQVHSVRPDAIIVDLRGNIDTRIRRGLKGELDGVILAAAGIHRLEWSDQITEYLPLDQFVPAPGQAALAIETARCPDDLTQGVSGLDDPRVAVAVRAERAFLREIGAGCTTPVGAHAVWEEDQLRLRAMLASEDLTRVEWAEISALPADSEMAAAELARSLLSQVEPARLAPVATQRAPGEIAHRPLAGLSVMVTRPSEQADDWLVALHDAGVEPVSAPVLSILPCGDDAIDAALKQVERGQFDWIAFTSANAVNRVRERLTPSNRTLPNGTRIAAVGRLTAKRLEDAGLSVDLEPDVATAEGLVAALTSAGLAGRRVWLPQGNFARPILADGLTAAGAEVAITEVYRTEPVSHLDPGVRERLLAGEIDIVTFASPSAVRALIALLPDGVKALDHQPIAVIGPTTERAAHEVGLSVIVTAAEPSSAGLVAALAEWRMTNRDQDDLTNTETATVRSGVS